MPDDQRAEDNDLELLRWLERSRQRARLAEPHYSSSQRALDEFAELGILTDRGKKRGVLPDSG